MPITSYGHGVDGMMPVRFGGLVIGQAICVYCSSSDRVDRCHFDLAHQFGQALGRRGDTLVFGGDRRGLMGTVARATVVMADKSLV